MNQTNAPASPDSVAVRVEIAPGKSAMMKIPEHKVGKFGLVKVEVEEGRPRIVWKSWHTKVKLTRTLPKELGLDMDVMTLRCLIHAGIVEGSKVSPSVTLIDLDSLVSHITAATGEGARGYWTQERRDAYSDAWDSMQSQGLTDRPRHRAHVPTIQVIPLPAPPPIPAPVKPKAPAAPITDKTNPAQLDLFN